MLQHTGCFLLDTNAIRVPSLDQVGFQSPPYDFVRLVRPEPSTFTTKMSNHVVSFRANASKAIFDPSGLQSGRFALLAGAVGMRVDSFVASVTMTRPPDSAYATRVPSGDHATGACCGGNPRTESSACPRLSST